MVDLEQQQRCWAAVWFGSVVFGRQQRNLCQHQVSSLGADRWCPRGHGVGDFSAPNRRSCRGIYECNSFWRYCSFHRVCLRLFRDVEKSVELGAVVVGLGGDRRVSGVAAFPVTWGLVGAGSFPHAMDFVCRRDANKNQAGWQLDGGRGAGVLGGVPSASCRKARANSLRADAALLGIWR